MNSVLIRVGEKYDAAKTIFEEMMDRRMGEYSITGLPDDEDERADACALAAVAVVTADVNGLVEEKEEEMVEAVQKFRMMMALEKLDKMGMVYIVRDAKDEYGFPLIAVNKDDIERLKRT